MAAVSHVQPMNAGIIPRFGSASQPIHFCGAGCGCDAAPRFGKSEDTVTLTYNPNTFRKEHGDYEYGKIYSPTGKLSWGQKICTQMIQWYQRKTRFNDSKVSGAIGKAISGGCPYPHHDKLSCSEYTLIAIHKLGVIRGIKAGIYRLMRCFAPPLSHWMAKNVDDPVYQINVKKSAVNTGDREAASVSA